MSTAILPSQGISLCAWVHASIRTHLAESPPQMILEGGQVKYIGPPQHTSLGLTETGDSSLALSKGNTLGPDVPRPH